MFASRRLLWQKYRLLESNLASRLVQVKYNPEIAPYSVRPIEKAVVHQPYNDEQGATAFEKMFYDIPEAFYLFMMDDKMEGKFRRQLQDSKEASAHSRN